MTEFQRIVRCILLLFIPLSAMSGFGLAAVLMGLGHAPKIDLMVAVPVALIFAVPHVFAFFAFARRNLLAHTCILLYFLGHFLPCVSVYRLIPNAMVADAGHVLDFAIAVGMVLIMFVPTLTLLAHFRRWPSEQRIT